VFNSLAILWKKMQLKILELTSLHVLEFVGNGWTDKEKERAYKLFQKYRRGMFNHWKLYLYEGKNGKEGPSASKEAPRWDEITFGGNWEELEKDLDQHFSG
jgi:hypothetical protein